MLSSLFFTVVTENMQLFLVLVFLRTVHLMS